MCDQALGTTAFASHEDDSVWLESGVLYTDGPVGPRVLGRLLQGRTRLWLGANFGVALSTVGETPVAATFTPRSSGIRDGLRLPGVKGRLLDAWCVFAAGSAWLFVHCLLAGRERIHTIVFDRTGHIEASSHGDASDPEFAWAMSARGACAAGSILLTPTDDGIVRVEARGGTLTPTRKFPDTAEFVDASTTLLATPMGLLAVTDRSVRQLSLT